MKEISEEAKARFFEEAGICLKRGGFQVGPVEDGFMPVTWRDAPLCRVNGVGGIRYRQEDVRSPKTEDALVRVLNIVNTAVEYMRIIEDAPTLKADGLDESYKCLNEFNGAVLAAHHSSRGWDFVTWCRDYSGEAVTQGHYVGGDYEGAKRDFTIRAGLVPQKELFSQEQLAEIHRCVETVRDMDLPMTVKREDRMDGILEQIRRAVPDLDARIGQAQNEDGQIADADREFPAFCSRVYCAQTGTSALRDVAYEPDVGALRRFLLISQQVVTFSSMRMSANLSLEEFHHVHRGYRHRQEEA